MAAAGWSDPLFTARSAVYLDRDRPLGSRGFGAVHAKRAGRWPIVVDFGIRVDGLIHAAESTEPEGVLQSVGYYSDALTPLPLGKLYTRGIRFFTGRAHAAAILPEVMNLIARGLLDPGAVAPTVIDWDDAPTRYLDDAIKLVVTR